MSIAIAQSALDTVYDHAMRESPHECCGLLLGHADRIVMAWLATNIARQPAVRYEIDPRDHFAAVRHARDRELDVVGAYHSHPRSKPYPSPTDLAEGIDDFVYLITGPVDESAWQARAFRLMDGNFRELILVSVA